MAFGLILGLAALLIARAGLGTIGIHDNLGVYWTWADQFTPELARGNLYPRWLPASYAGLGAPVFYYYPPLAFYLTALFGLAGLSTYASLIAAFGCAFGASGISCWSWLRGRTNHPLIAACLFMAAPYHMFDYVDRAALPECVAIALIPVLAIGLRRIAERRGGVSLTAVAYALMIGAHLPLALLTSIFFVAPFALRHRQQIRAFSLSVTVGVSLAAISLLPALALAPYHDGAQLYREPFLRPGYWSLFAGNFSDPTFVRVHVIAGAIVATAALILARRKCGWAAYAIGVAAIVAGLLPFVWSLPLIEQVQFPYRALPLAEFALATAIARLPRGDSAMPVCAAMMLVVSASMLPGLGAPADNLERLKALHPDVYEYLPKGVLQPGQTHARLAEVLAPRVPPPSVSGMVVEPLFYFRAWSCGQPEPRTKLLMHEPDCRPRIVWTLPEKIGAALSIMSALALLIVGWRRRERAMPAPVLRQPSDFTPEGSPYAAR